MRQTCAAILEPSPPVAKTAGADVPFGVNEVRLNLWQWIVALLIVAAVVIAAPRIWKKAERFDTGRDYRIPYALSKDYWLYERRLEKDASAAKVIVLGDSVVWGEYVRPDGTLSHFLSKEEGGRVEFVNCGVNGLFPLAMEGLVEYYATELRGRKIILHCNVLWMSSPKADLRVEKEESFNHTRLVPQFWPWIPCYKADAAERLSVVIERHVSFSAWVGHLQNAYFDQRSVPTWTLEDDGGSPPVCPNAWRNPLAQIRMKVEGEPADDPQRGLRSARHKPWFVDSISICFVPCMTMWFNSSAGPTHFDWVDLDTSLQWQAFGRTVRLLQSRGNDVLVVVGPFNEHMVAEDQRPTYEKMREGIRAWLERNHVAHVVPDLLPSELYADASHPLTEGYALLARRIAQTEAFQNWMKR